MNLAKRFLYGAMTALMFAACSDDKIDVGSDGQGTLPEDQQPGVFFSLRIDLPNAGGSRSVTEDPTGSGSASSGGFEIGKDYENAVNEAIIVLADAHANEFIAAAAVTAGNLTAQNPAKSSFVAKSKFSKQELSSYYDFLTTANAEWKNADKPLKTNIFVFCNPSLNLRAKLLGDMVNGEQVEGPEQGSTDWLMETGKIITPNSVSGDGTSSIWSHDAFLMTNALIAERELPANITSWNAFTTEDNPFNLSGSNTLNTTDEEGKAIVIDNLGNGRGAIKVERACARFDFRDASENEDFTYDVLYVEENGVPTEEVLVKVTLQKMFLVNQSNSFYYLPRTVAPVAADGSSIVGVTKAELLAGICQPEQPWVFDGNGGYTTPFGNYVADYNIAWKNSVYLAWKDGDYEEGEGDKNDEDTSGSTSTSPAAFDSYFNYPFFNNDGTIDNTDVYSNRWPMYLCSDVVKGETQNTEGWGPDKNHDVYKIWCYSTENTIPSIQGQINGISTGVVFKAKFSSPTDIAEKTNNANTIAVAEAFNNDAEGTDKDPIIFMYEKVLYAGWENLREAAINSADAQFVFIKTGEEEDKDGNLQVTGYWELRSINRTGRLYRAVFGKGGIGGDFVFRYYDEATKTYYNAKVTDDLAVDENSANYAYEKWAAAGYPDGDNLEGEDKIVKDAFKAAATGQGIALYQRSYDANFGWGYYCYYYYWNRHNDNGFNGIMGPMEFAVVRNNVYKLAVTKINNLGHPRISENDPHKPGPGTPDEDESVYIEVTSEVLPWVVRVNNIEF